MGKATDASVIDAAFNLIKNGTVKMVLCSAQPLTYAEANATYKLAEIAMVSGDFTLANGDVSGRKMTIAAKAAVPVTVTGTGNHIAVIDTVALALRDVTTCPAQAVGSGGTVDIATWKHEINSPT